MHIASVHLNILLLIFLLHSFIRFLHSFYYTAEEDFSTVIKILEFHPGDTYIDVNISIINDESIEGNETFTIYLTSDVGVNVSPYVQT